MEDAIPEPVPEDAMTVAGAKVLALALDAVENGETTIDLTEADEWCLPAALGFIYVLVGRVAKHEGITPKAVLVNLAREMKDLEED